MSHKNKSESVGLYADEDSIIIADGTTVTGFDIAAKAKNRSTISLKGAITDSESKIANNKDKFPIKKWYEKPIGLIVLGVVITVTGSFITKFFF